MSKENLKILLNQVLLTSVGTIAIFGLFAFLPILENLSLPEPSKIMLKIAVGFGIVFIAIIVVLGNIVEELNNKRRKKWT